MNIYIDLYEKIASFNVLEARHLRLRRHALKCLPPSLNHLHWQYLFGAEPRDLFKGRAVVICHMTIGVVCVSTWVFTPETETLNFLSELIEI